ncbi:MAG TPA: efflux RND transporter periplasmic adaptor subunit, partial [Candidatus Binataceae bacterium]|nr:efflux RND transporter periplasmic adaptor subunit [Candidatus Binataceae bacterium]
ERKTYTPPPTGKFFVAGWIAAVIAVVALTAGLVLARELWLGRQSSELEREYQQGRRVLVTRVIHGPRTREIRLPATIHGFTETQIYAKVAGYLKKINVDKGDRVVAGQVLAILDSPELDHQVQNARATYQLQKLTDRRIQMLLRSGVTSQQAADESHAAMLEAKASLDQLVATQAYEVIKAPFAGLITARFVDPGALIPQSTTPSAGGTPIVAMATMTPLRIYADVPQSFAPFIKDGDRAKLTVAEYPQRTFQGAVTRHSDALNADTRTMRVEVDLENRDLALMPGMYAIVDFAVALPIGVPMVPDDALVFRGDKVYVPVVREHRMHLAEATLGYDNGVAVEITSGVGEDDVVAISVGQSAREGEIVQPVLEDSQRGQQ